MHYHRSINGAVDQRWSLQWSALHQMSNFRFLRKRWLNADHRWSALILKTVILHRFFHKKTLLFQSTLINDENDSFPASVPSILWCPLKHADLIWSTIIYAYQIISSLIRFYHRLSNFIIADQRWSSLIKFYHRLSNFIIADQIWSS